MTGAELAWACRDFAVRQYGLLAFEVLNYWGVRRTEDIGRIVFVLVHTKVLSAEPTDREQDFAGCMTSPRRSVSPTGGTA